MGGVIQSLNEGQFVNYFCPLVFVKGLQFTITWTKESLKVCRETILYKIKGLKDISLFSTHSGIFVVYFYKNQGCWKHKEPVVI